MINEERVRLMTKMAMEEKRNGHLPDSVHLQKKAYVADRMFYAFIVGSLLFWMLFFVIAGLLYLLVLTQISTTGLVIFAIAGAVLYLLTLYTVLRQTRLRAIKSYKKLRARLKRIISDWDELEALS